MRAARDSEQNAIENDRQASSSDIQVAYIFHACDDQSKVLKIIPSTRCSYWNKHTAQWS